MIENPDTLRAAPEFNSLTGRVLLTQDFSHIDRGLIVDRLEYSRRFFDMPVASDVEASVSVHATTPPVNKIIRDRAAAVGAEPYNGR